MKRDKSIQAVIRRARAQGRAEAVTIIASLCPEDGINQLIGCSPNGESGDYSSYWDVDALRKLLCADTEVCDKIDRLQGAHEFTHYLEYDLAKVRDELARAKRQPLYSTLIDAARFRLVARDMLSELARRYGNDVSDELSDVLRNMDADIDIVGEDELADNVEIQIQIPQLEDMKHVE